VDGVSPYGFPEAYAVGVIVQKFGGSSVADAAKIRHCASRIAEAKRQGHDVAVVVSARGDTTDDLLAMAAEITDAPDKREMDQLLATGEQISISLMSMALKTMGLDAVSLTGGQCGIRTDGSHTRARIVDVDPVRMESAFKAGKIPVVAGFQGVCETGDVTTLGRGGSDTTAVALAAALKADECQIFTDVDGVYTADPRIVPHAYLKEVISYDEMMEAASQGAKVMHLRAVELGKKAGVPIRVLHSLRHGRGTLITDDVTSMETQRAVSSVALKTDMGRVTLAGLPNQPGLQRRIFDRIAAAGISIDDIIQTEALGRGGNGGADAGQAFAQTHADTPTSGLCNIVFTLDKTDLADVRPLIEKVLEEIGQGRLHVDLGLAKVSAVGVGMQSQPGVAAKMFKALAEVGIRIANITTSEIKISCIVDEADGKTGLRAVHDAFELGTPVVTTARTGAKVG
jgi:aspartate kinase